MIRKILQKAADKLSDALIPKVEAEDLELTDNDVDPPTMSTVMKAVASTRDLILDSNLDQPKELFDLLGLPPISDEVLDMERQESDERVARVIVLNPALIAYSSTLAYLVSASLADAVGQLDTTDPTVVTRWANFERTIQSSMYAALVGGLSQLMDNDLIELSPVLMGD